MATGDLDLQKINSDVLGHRAHEDLTERARGGIIIYLFGWLALTLPTGVYESQTSFFLVNTGVLAAIMVVRLIHLLGLKTESPQQVQFASTVLVWTILGGAFHWGLMSAWVLSHDEYRQLDFYLIASAGVLGIGGTTALSIAKEIRIAFPLAILAPVVATLLWRGTTDDVIMATLALLALGYVTITAKAAHQDYWRAITNELLAQQRALEMEALSVTDQLTKLKNRSYFDGRFNEEWKRGSRHERPLSVLMLDLDHFKRLNDNHGHVFGDEVLRRVAATLHREVYREADVVARYGGEEFVVILPDTDAKSARVVAERIRKAIYAIDIRAGGTRLQLSCSIGGATSVPDRGTSPEVLLKHADAALYEAKGAGRNLYCAGAPISFEKKQQDQTLISFRGEKELVALPAT